MRSVVPNIKSALIKLKPYTWLGLGLLTMCGMLPRLNYAEAIKQPTIAIIIDDIGHDYTRAAKLIGMPYPLTLAFLPERPYTQKLANLALQQRKEIMLHAPMENKSHIGLGRGGLTREMSEQDFKLTLEKSLRSIPNVVGVNNHMGSLLTTNKRQMSWVMETLRNYPVYFVDSRTSAASVAARTAQSHGIPNMSRDVFLDHEQDRDFVQKQFLKLIEKARTNGTAIGIGHPHQVTVDYLRLALPKLDEKGVRIATASALWQIRNPGLNMFANKKPKESKPLQLASRQKQDSDPVSNLH